MKGFRQHRPIELCTATIGVDMDWVWKLCSYEEILAVSQSMSSSSIKEQGTSCVHSIPHLYSCSSINLLHSWEVLQEIIGHIQTVTIVQGKYPSWKIINCLWRNSETEERWWECCKYNGKYSFKVEKAWWLCSPEGGKCIRAHQVLLRPSLSG